MISDTLVFDACSIIGYSYYLYTTIIYMRTADEICITH